MKCITENIKNVIDVRVISAIYPKKESQIWDLLDFKKC